MDTNGHGEKHFMKISGLLCVPYMYDHNIISYKSHEYGVRSFHPTFISPQVHFIPHIHIHFTPRSFHPTFISHHIVLIQKRLTLINQLPIQLWCLLSSS